MAGLQDPAHTCCQHEPGLFICMPAAARSMIHQDCLAALQAILPPLLPHYCSPARLQVPRARACHCLSAGQVTLITSASFMHAEAAEGTIAIGTLEYSAPEVLEDKADVDWKRAEVWTLGLVLLELVSPVWCDMVDRVPTDSEGRLLPESLQRACTKWVSAACHSCRV